MAVLRSVRFDIRRRGRGFDRRFARRIESVGQGYGRQLLEVRIVDDRWIDEVSYRQLEGLTGIEPLRGEAEALDLVEVAAGLVRRHVEHGHPDLGRVRQIRGAVEGEPLLDDLELLLALHRLEPPGDPRP